MTDTLIVIAILAHITYVVVWGVRRVGRDNDELRGI